ncbi:hypothetical protein BC567DRAFT_239698 [Phyllosticta citribraziliensis]
MSGRFFKMSRHILNCPDRLKALPPPPLLQTSQCPVPSATNTSCPCPSIHPTTKHRAPGVRNVAKCQVLTRYLFKLVASPQVKSATPKSVAKE